jgi:hypothetical protein
MLGQWRFVEGVVDGVFAGLVVEDPGVVVDVDPLEAALEMALPAPTPTPMVPPKTARPAITLANRLFMLLLSFAVR